MEQGSWSLDELRNLLLQRPERRVWIKAQVRRTDEGVKELWYAHAVIGPRPETWQDRKWEYPGWTFSTAKTSARMLAAALSNSEASELVDGEFRVGLPATGNVSWLRHASRQVYAGVDSPWPSQTATVYLTGADTYQPGGFMVGSSAPSFPTFAGAFSAFFWDEWRQTGASLPALNQVVISIVDDRARIRRVKVGPAAVDVWVGGQSVRGCELELNSSSDRLIAVVEKPGRISLPLRTGIGEDPWIWLKCGADWIDYRAVTGWGARRSPDVHIEQPEDSVADMTALASCGESTHLEYKSELPGDTADSKRKVLKTVAAFANGDGGTILFGVEGDEEVGQIRGLPGKPALLQRRLNDLVRDCVTPAPSFKIVGEYVDEKYVLRLEVESGNGVLHALVLNSNRPEYYVRRNGSTYHAHPDELWAVYSRAASGLPQ